MRQVYKCHKCKDPIMTEEELIQHDISSTNKKMPRKFHKICLEEYLAEKKFKKEKKKGSDLQEKPQIPKIPSKHDEEYQSWDDLYQYVRKEIMGYKEYMKLPGPIVHRLLGLRSGNGFNKKGEKAFGGKGYSFEVILTTFKLNKARIINATYNKDFASDVYKFNYIMAIIDKSIADVAIRYEKREHAMKRVEHVDVGSTGQGVGYKPKKKDNVIGNMLKDLW